MALTFTISLLAVFFLGLQHLLWGTRGITSAKGYINLPTAGMTQHLECMLSVDSLYIIYMLTHVANSLYTRLRNF